MIRTLKPLLLAAALFGVAAPVVAAESNVMFIVDASGSMKRDAGGATRMDIAKKALAESLGTIPDQARLGLMLYGHRRAKDCTDIELVSPLGADPATTLAQTILALQPKGETPIAEALKQATRSFAAFRGQQNRIVLVTDGIEECNGDPCAAAKAVKDAGVDLKVDVVGFTLDANQRKTIQCITDTTGGKYYDAQDARGLSAALQDVRAAVAQEAPPRGLNTPPVNTNLLSPATGGTLLLAPNYNWTQLSDDREERVAMYGGEGVWSFKDGKPATFGSFEVLIPGVDQYNVKDIELLIGDEGPGGQFRSIGTLTTQNLKTAGSGYQKFDFPPVTARYLKVSLKTSWGNSYIAGNELRLTGTIDEAATSNSPAAAEGTDLLAFANGGRLIYAPNVEWEKLNDGKLDRATTYAGEGVWQFKDGKLATFSRFEFAIPETYQYNAKTFELLAGDDSPTGSFRAIGVFTTVNARAMPSTYQAFNFAPVTARFIKLNLQQDWGGGYIAANDVRLFGTIDAASSATPPAAASVGVDLLSPSNGGALLASTSDVWSKLTAGGQERAVVYKGEGVWAFRNEKPATFDTFELLVPGRDKYNLKEFELSVADDSPAGPFRSLGVFTAQNARFTASPYQRFTFAPVTAKYLKLTTKTDWGGGYIAAYGARLIGQVSP